MPTAYDTWSKAEFQYHARPRYHRYGGFESPTVRFFSRPETESQVDFVGLIVGR
jgi:hypothetical protein